MWQRMNYVKYRRKSIDIGHAVIRLDVKVVSRPNTACSRSTVKNGRDLSVSVNIGQYRSTPTIDSCTSSYEPKQAEEEVSKDLSTGAP
jgi:hypothetical protein